MRPLLIFPVLQMTEFGEIRLKPNAERRIRVGHSWIYSNEIDTARTALKAMTPGQLANVVDARGKAMGTAYAHPNSLIAARLLSRKPDAVPDAAWFGRRLQRALSLREALYPTPHYRLVYGESDGLPGLVVDRFDDVLVLQISTAGMENLKPVIIEALQQLLKPRGMLLRNDSGARDMEALPKGIEVIGDPGETCEVMESGVRFQAEIQSGQKTGWFYDQRDNRDRLARYNAAANGVEVAVVRGSALDVLKQMRTDARSFDVVIVDPPALIKRRKDHKAGLEHYASLNRAAMALLSPGGTLISCSCSFHLAEEDLLRVLLREARAQNRQLQGPDHPVHPAITETRYLKTFYCRLS